MRRFLLAVALLLPVPAAAQLPAGRPEDAGMSAARLALADSLLDDLAASAVLPGGVLVVARHGRVVHRHAFGFRDREARDPMPTDGLFRIASQTKAIVSVAAMMLQEEGRLSIQEPVGFWIPAFWETTVAVPREGGGYDVVPAERPITVRDLLTHMAGIGYGNGVARDRWEAAGIQGWYFADRAEPIAETVARIAELPFDAQPGERWVYGYATDILGAVVEAAAGEPLDAFLRRRILEPLGMRDTHFYVPPAQRGRLVTVYSRTDSLFRAPDEGTMESQGAYVDGPRASFSGGAGLVSTADDYARFLQMLLNGGSLDGVRILSPKTVELMTVDHTDGRYGAPGSGFGLGFSVLQDLGARGTPGSLGEYGWGGAYHSTYWVDPQEDLVVVYLTQVIPARGLVDFGRVRALVYGAITEAGSAAPRDAALTR